jgi:translation initiation factor IF-1
MFDPPITTTGTIIDSPKPKIYHVSLPNGKIVIGHVQKAKIHLHDTLKTGDTVNLELTPFDFEKARITSICTPEPSS